MKILACDYDGTLNYGGMDEAKLAAIKKWRDAGNKLGVVSGRDLNLIDLLQTEYALTLDFLVSFNGAYIVNAEKKELYKIVCKGIKSVSFAEDLFSLGADFVAIHTEKRYMIRRKKKDLQENEYWMKDVPDVSYFYQTSVRFQDFESAAQAVKRILEKYGAFVTPLQNGVYVDVVPKGVNKANGIYRVMESYNAEYKDVIVVGDNLNDMDMIREFRSYAMENGVDEIKKIATYRTKTVTDLIEKEL